jgi:hypothetical protein
MHHLQRCREGDVRFVEADKARGCRDSDTNEGPTGAAEELDRFGLTRSDVLAETLPVPPTDKIRALVPLTEYLVLVSDREVRP